MRERMFFADPEKSTVTYFTLSNEIFELKVPQPSRIVSPITEDDTQKYSPFRGDRLEIKVSPCAIETIMDVGSKDIDAMERVHRLHIPERIMDDGIGYILQLGGVLYQTTEPDSPHNIVTALHSGSLVVAHHMPPDMTAVSLQ